MDFLGPPGPGVCVNPALAVVTSPICSPVKELTAVPFILLLVLSSVHSSFDAHRLESVFRGPLASTLMARGLSPGAVGMQVIHCQPEQSTWGSLPATYFPAIRLLVPDPICSKSSSPFWRSLPGFGRCTLAYTGSVDQPQFLFNFVARHVRKFDDTVFISPSLPTNDNARFTYTRRALGGDGPVIQLLVRKARRRTQVDFATAVGDDRLSLTGCLVHSRLDLKNEKFCMKKVSQRSIRRADRWMEEKSGGFSVEETGPEEFNRVLNSAQGLIAVLLVTDFAWRNSVGASAFHQLSIRVRKQRSTWKFIALRADKYTPFLDALRISHASPSSELPILVISPKTVLFDTIPFDHWRSMTAVEFIRVGGAWSADPNRSKLTGFLANAHVEDSVATANVTKFQVSDIDSSVVRDVEFPDANRTVPVLLFVHAPFCGFSQAFRAVLLTAKKQLIDSGVRLDEDMLFVEHSTACNRDLPPGLEVLVEGYPTLMVLERGSNKTSVYSSGRSAAKVTSFALQHARPAQGSVTS